MIFAVIAAGGSGTRMGAAIPKQYLPLNGKPIIIHTIEVFAACPFIDEIYVGADAQNTDKLYRLCSENGLDMNRIFIITGGSDRNSTVFAAADEMIRRHGLNENDIILTHDGVRPFVTEGIIRANIDALENFDGAATAVASSDTLFYSSSDGKTIENVPDRARMFRAQTPQTFRLKKLKEAYSSLSQAQKNTLTDTAGIFHLCGIPVAIVAGDEKNIKITTPYDLALAEFTAKYKN